MQFTLELPFWSSDSKLAAVALSCIHYAGICVCESIR